MSSDWASLTVGDLVLQGEATIQTGPFGSQLHSHDYVAVGTPVIPTEAIGRGRILDIDVPKVGSSKAAELWRHRLRRGDILFARRRAGAEKNKAFSVRKRMLNRISVRRRIRRLSFRNSADISILIAEQAVFALCRSSVRTRLPRFLTMH